MVIKGPKQGMELKFLEMAQKIIQDIGLVLYDLNWNPSMGQLTVFILDPKTQTATLDDCMKVDRGFNPYMETEEWIPENFTLEISSPGLYRELSQIDHFKKVEGEEISLHLNKKIDEEKYPNFPKAFRNNLKLKGKLLSVADDAIFFELKGTALHIPYVQIKKANLETDLSQHKENN